MAEGEEITAPYLRGRLTRLASKLKKHHDRFIRTLAEDSPATTDFHSLEEALDQVKSLQRDNEKKVDLIEELEADEEQGKRDDVAHDEFSETAIATKFSIHLLLSKRAVHRALVTLEVEVEGANQAYMAEPTKDFSTTVEEIKAKRDTLMKLVEATSLIPTAPLMQQAAAVLKTSSLVQAKLRKTAAPEVRAARTTSPMSNYP